MPAKRPNGHDNVVSLTTNGLPVGYGRPPSQKGAKATPKQSAAMAKGRASIAEKQKIARERKESGVDDGPTRWERLISGDLTVQDLDDQELAKMRCRNHTGEFLGRAPNVPGRLVRAMKEEFIRRGEKGFAKYGLQAIKVVAGIMNGLDTDNKDKLRAAVIIIERVYGKVPEQYRATVESAWDETYEDVATEFDDEEAETA